MAFYKFCSRTTAKNYYNLRVSTFRYLTLLTLTILYVTTIQLTPAQASNNTSMTSSVRSSKPITKAKPCLLKLNTRTTGSLRCIAPEQIRPAYNDAVKRMDALKKHEVQSCWRQPWETLRNTFLSVYQSRTDWALSPLALFKAAQCQETLARCSHLGEDFRMAMTIYEAVANEFPKCDLADDALSAAVAIAKTNMKNNALAEKYLAQLSKNYPQAALLKNRKRNAGKPDGEATNKKPVTKTPELESISWDSVNKNRVDIQLDFSSCTRFNPAVRNGKNNSSILEIDIYETRVVSEIRRGASINGSLLRAVTVQTRRKGHTLLVFEFSKLEKFTQRTANNGSRIILTCMADKSGKNSENAKKVNTIASERITSNTGLFASMASSYTQGITTVAIDAGHGGKDPGTIHNGVKESTLVLDISKRLGRLLQANGMRIIYTRKSDKFISLARRTQIANDNRADLFISIHINAHKNPSARGFSVYYGEYARQKESQTVANRENGNKKNSKKLRQVSLSARTLASLRLAHDIHRRATRNLVRHGTHAQTNGVKSAPLYVLGKTKMPAILAEVGYCTNQYEAHKLLSPAYQQVIAESLAEGIISYRDRLLNRMTAERSPLSKTRIDEKKRTTMN